MGKKIKRSIDLSGLPRGGLNRGNRINWGASLGYEVDFVYDDIKGKVKIINYVSKYLYVKYLDKNIFKIDTVAFSNCRLGKLLGKITDDFKIEIGRTINDLLIIDRDYKYYTNGKKYKAYKYKCKCGFDCGEHYKNGEHREEFWIDEGNLLKGQGCACCCPTPRVVVPEINSIVANEETKWMVKYFQGGYDEAKKYTFKSEKEIQPICPDCGRVRNGTIRISSLYEQKFSCVCQDGIGYPEKFIANALKQLDLKYIQQLSKKTFKWCNKYRYDFLIDSSVILEAHGMQHYEDNTSFSMKIKEVQENDRHKKQLAINNGIKEENYIVVDCRKSNMEFIKNNILDSKLSELYDLSIINWDKCAEFAMSNLSKIACDLYNESDGELSCPEIGFIIGINRNTITKWLKMWSQLGLCDYDPKEELKKSGLRQAMASRKAVEIYNNGIKVGTFQSCSELERASMGLFGVKLYTSPIGKVARGKKSKYKGFTFKYVEVVGK